MPLKVWTADTSPTYQQFKAKAKIFLKNQITQ